MQPSTTPFDPAAERRRGEAYVEAGFVAAPELEECLALQTRRAAVSAGDVPPIDRILVAKGYLEPAELGAVDRERARASAGPLVDLGGEEDEEEEVATDGATIARCPECFRAYRIPDFQPDNHGCIECGGLLIEVAEAIAPSIDPEPPPAGSAEALEVGLDFDGYPIRAAVGADDLGTTYLCSDPRDGRDVSLKIFHPERAGDAFLRRDFLRNARRAARLNHPGIQRLHRIGRRGRLFYTVTDPIAGRTLEDFLADRGPLGYEEGVELIYRIADCLAFAHENRVVHRNLHPSRIVIGPEGSVHLLGAGLFLPVADERPTARPRSGESPPEEPIYLAPEQAREPWLFDPRTDIFALGGTAYRIFSGEAAYRGRSAADILAQYLQWGVPSLERRSTDLPKPLVRLVERMLFVEPESRPQKIEEILELLEALPKKHELAIRVRGSMDPETAEEGAWPGDSRRMTRPEAYVAAARTAAMPRWAKEKIRPPARRRLSLAVLRELVPWQDPAVRLACMTLGAIVVLLLVHRGISSSVGLEHEESIVVETAELEEAGPPIEDALTPEEAANLLQFRGRIEEALSKRRPGEALTVIERALSIGLERNPWAGDLWFARGLAAYQIARSGWGISDAERPTYVEMAVESYARAAETYLRPGARTRFDPERGAAFPFQRPDAAIGDLGYAWTIASQSRDSVREMCSR